MKKSIVRVKSGKFSDNAFIFCVPEGEEVLPLDQIEFISLGKIEEEIADVKPEMSGIRKKIRQMLMGESQVSQRDIPAIKTTYFIDIFRKNSDRIYRFDSSYINYKDFIGEIELISVNNFKKFIAKLKDFIGNIDTTPDFKYFSENKIDKISKHESIFDFEIYNAKYSKKFKKENTENIKE